MKTKLALMTLMILGAGMLCLATWMTGCGGEEPGDESISADVPAEELADPVPFAQERRPPELATVTPATAHPERQPELAAATPGAVHHQAATWAGAPVTVGPRPSTACANDRCHVPPARDGIR